MEAFHRSKKRKDGHSFKCKVCVSAYAHDYHLANREKRCAYVHEYYLAHREKKRDYDKAYMQTYNPIHADKQRAYSRNHPEQVKRTQQKYYQTHTEQRKAYARTHNPVQNARMRARRIQAPGAFTLQEWEDLKAFYQHTCLSCGKQEPEIKLSPDHVIPFSKGGSNSIDNIQPLCRSCNNQKFDKTTDYRNTVARSHDNVSSSCQTINDTSYYSEKGAPPMSIDTTSTTVTCSTCEQETAITSALEISVLVPDGITEDGETIYRESSEVIYDCASCSIAQMEQAA